MWVKKISLDNFRNLKDQNNSLLSLTFSSKLNFINGLNGQGKTNLLEAINYLCSGKSFRRAGTSELITQDSTKKFILLEGEIVDSIGSNLLKWSLGKEERCLEENNQNVRDFATFSSKYPTIFFHPGEIELIKGVPEVRRDFLDRAVLNLNPNLTATYKDFYKALLNKKKLLKSEIFRSQDAALLIKQFNFIISEASERIFKVRLLVLEKAAQLAQEYYQVLGGQKISLDLKLKNSLLNTPHVTADELFNKLQKNLSLEVERRSPLLGPQRGDVEVLLNNLDTRSFASQGQAKSIVVALKLALVSLIKVIRGVPPIVLLDDPEAELDYLRQQRLYEVLTDSSEDQQIFITGCNPISKCLRFNDYSYTVHDGVVVENFTVAVDKCVEKSGKS